MTAPRPGQSYLSSTKARSLQETFVTNVRKAMAERKWSRRVLSEKSGVPMRTIENLLDLNNQPTMVGAALVAQALGVPLDTLTGQPTFGMTEAQAVIVNGVEHGATTSPRIQCLHKRAWIGHGLDVCERCLNKFNSYQRRLRELYEESRKQHGDNWREEQDVENVRLLKTACPNCKAGICTHHKPGCPQGQGNIWNGR